MKTKIITISLIIIAIIAVLILTITNSNKKNESLPVEIVSSIPQNGASQVDVSQPITVTFNQDIKASQLSVSSNPSEEWLILQNNPKSITINHGLYLKVATTYKVSITKDNAVIGSFSFQTVFEQNDPRQLQILQSDIDKNYPLAKVTPYETPDYKVIYVSPLTFDIKIKSNLDRDEVLNQIKFWVKSNGVDPISHTYLIDTGSPKP